MGQLVFDERLADKMESLARAADMERRRGLVHSALAAGPGERLLDIGCGPGFYVSELLDVVGADGSVVGIDISPQMLAVAAHRCDGHPNVFFHEGDATSPRTPRRFRHEIARTLARFGDQAIR
jgi:arsenite methyltransferase